MTYTLNTTLQQENLLTWITKHYNLEHDSQLTNADYINMRLPQLLAPYVSVYQQSLNGSVTQALASADAVTQAKVLSLLGVTP